MELDTKIIKRYENGYVQLEIGSNTLEPKYYKLPESKVDEFQSEFQKNKKKINFINGGILLGTIFGVILAASAFTKNMTNRALKVIINIASGVAGGIGSIAISNAIERNSHQKLMAKYNATPTEKPNTKIHA